MGPRILITRGGGVGDVLLATTVIQPLRHKFPWATIHMATEERNIFVVEGFTELDEVIGLRDTAEVFVFSPPGYDLQYHLHYEAYPHLHILDAFGLITELDLKNKLPVIKLSETDREFAEEIWQKHGLKKNGLVIGVHRGPTWAIRSWPKEKFLTVMRFLKANYGTEWIEFSSTPNYFLGEGIDLTGKTSLFQAAAVIERCALVLCIDSLIMHLASAVKTPVAAIFGGTDPDKRLPRNNMSIGIQANIDCHGCHHKLPMRYYSDCSKPSIECMDRLKPERVIKAVEQLLFDSPFPQMANRMRIKKEK